MEDGIYESTFTTNTGTLGTAAVLIRNGTFVGADQTMFYRGNIDQSQDGMTVIMEVTRHDFSMESAFGSSPLFTLKWTGEAPTESTYKLSCQPEDTKLTIYAMGRLLAPLA